MENLIPIMSWIWLGVFVLLVTIEACTLALTTIWGAISALVLIFVSRTGLALKWQILIFLCLTIFLLLTTRPFAIKVLKLNKPTNFAAIIGQKVVVTKRIKAFEKGEARSKNGVIWTAYSNDGTEIEEGAICKVVSVEGNTIMLESKGDDK